MRLTAALVALIFLGLLAQPVQAASEATNALEICGTLRAHSAATPTADGSLRIGSRTYPTAAGVLAGNGGVEVAVGRDLCVTASIGLTSGRLVRYLFFPMLSGDRVCGNLIRPTTEGSFALRADFGELTLFQGSPPAALDNPGMRLCYSFRIDGASGDLVAGEKMFPRAGSLDLERVTKCGTVKSYVPASAASSGQIEIGSRGFRIAAGTSYTGDPAGDRTDRTAVGQAMCLSATLDAAIVQYLTRPMETSIMGTASVYTPPSGGAPGIAILSYATRYELRIPAALDATIDVARSTYCYAAAVDASGDMTANAAGSCPPGGVGGAAGSGPGVATAAPMATAVPSASLVAVASPSPGPEAPSGYEPRWLIVPALLAGVAALAYLARRRGVGTP